MIRIGIVGCTGRLAKQIIDLIQNDDKLVLLKAITRPNSEYINTNVSDYTEYKKSLVFVENDVMNCTECDVIIDATKRDVFINQNYEKYLILKKPLIIATTGFNDEDLEKISLLGMYAPVIHSANFSVELHYLIKAIKTYVSVQRPLDITIIEKHHKAKIDSPSGTALMIKKELLNANADLSVNILSVRAGAIVGEHSVLIANQDGEEIEFTHRATNRSIFAKGIIKLLYEILNTDNGVFEMQYLL